MIIFRQYLPAHRDAWIFIARRTCENRYPTYNYCISFCAGACTNYYLFINLLQQQTADFLFFKFPPTRHQFVGLLLLNVSMTPHILASSPRSPFQSKVSIIENCTNSVHPISSLHLPHPGVEGVCWNLSELVELGPNHTVPHRRWWWWRPSWPRIAGKMTSNNTETSQMETCSRALLSSD